MSETPDTRVRGAQRKKPTLVILDDEEKLLLRYARRFTALGYDVKPVLVLPEDREYDRDLFHGGRLKQEWTAAEQSEMKDYAWQDKQVSLRTVATALREAEQRAGTNRRYDHEVAFYRRLRHIPYGVKNAEEAAALLSELKPDYVLSDYQMRQKDYVPEGTEFVGSDVMELAAKICPDAPRAIHTGMYKVDPEWSTERQDSMRSQLMRERVFAEKDGHGLFAKQESQHKPSFAAKGPVREIQQYFQSQSKHLGLG